MPESRIFISFWARRLLRRVNQERKNGRISGLLHRIIQ
jgi:hypothetical protein